MKIQMILLLALCILLIACAQTGSTILDTPGLVGDVNKVAEVNKVVNTPLANDAIYELRPSSILLWESSKVKVTHKGTIGVEGNLIREDKIFTKGSFTIDMHSITEEKDNQKFLGQIRSDAFFNIETYSTSKLVITNVKHEDDNNYKIIADLTILDKTKEITFPAVIQGLPKGIRILAVFDIDRTRWGITYNSGNFFKDLGDNLIDDEITYGLDLEFIEN